MGDWDFVEHVGDRHPNYGSLNMPKKVLTYFEDIKKLCAMKDALGRGPAPTAWTYSKATQNGVEYSWLDWIYQPSLGWGKSKVLPMATKWSDHRLLIATVYVKRPKIEKALPAPRLPNLEVLEKAHKFWPSMLTVWERLMDNGPVTLEKWKVFKDHVLQTGRSEVNAMKKMGWKDWVATLKCEQIVPEDIITAAFRANAMLWARQTPPARTTPDWPAAVPVYKVAPARQKYFTPSPNSPWQIPHRRGVPAHIMKIGEVLKFATLEAKKKVSVLLEERDIHFTKAMKAKMERMTRTHSSEWYKLSSNKELNERGSRASVSVEGLRKPGEALTHTTLTEMASIAKDYFFDLHTPEPSPQKQENAQAILLEETRL